MKTDIEKLINKCKFLNDVHKFIDLGGDFIGYVIRPFLRGEKIDISESEIDSKFNEYKNHWIVKFIEQKKFMGVYFDPLNCEYKINNEYCSSILYGYKHGIDCDVIRFNEIDVKNLLLQEIKNNDFCSSFIRNIDNGFEILKTLGKDEESLRLLNEGNYQLWKSTKESIPEEDLKTNLFNKKMIDRTKRNKYYEI